MKMRTRGVNLTNEARLLRELRQTKGLSMRAAGELCGKTDSYISQVEHGRMNPPTGYMLERLLDIYGGIPVEDYCAKAKRYREKIGDKDEIIELLKKTN